MRFAYADPPYPGMAHLYKDHPDYAGEVDHKALIARLVEEFPDGWALSTGSSNLKEVLAICPDKVRVLPWCIRNVPWRPGCNVIYAWHPTIMLGGRRTNYIVNDFVVTNNGSGLLGAKHPDFCFWLFRCLGAQPGDELIDLFPGSGAVGRAWESYIRQVSLPLDTPRLGQLAMHGADESALGCGLPKAGRVFGVGKGGVDRID